MAPSAASVMGYALSRGIDEDIGDVGDQVQRDVDRRRHQHDALHDGVVAVEHGIDDQLAEARNRKNLLGQHRARQQRAEFERAQRDDRRQRVAHGVLEDDRAFGKALGAGGADVIAFQHLQHGAAGVPHQDRGDGVAEHEGRHDGGGEAGAPVFGQRHIARRRQPAEFDREQEDQHDAEPEIRRRDAPQREQIGAVVPGRALLHRRHDAGGDADQERDHDRHRRQLHCHRQLLRDQLAHRHLDAQRLAEVARQHALDPVDILHRDRLIEPVLLRGSAR